MTQDEIIEMARQAGIVVTGEAIYTLCKLIAAKEREDCAELAMTISEQGLPEEMPEGDELLDACKQIAGGVLIAEAIRERGHHD